MSNKILKWAIQHLWLLLCTAATLMFGVYVSQSRDLLQQNRALLPVVILGCGVLLALALYNDQLQTLRAKVWFYKRATRLKPADVNGNPEWYRNYFIEPTAVPTVLSLLGEQKSAVLIGIPEIGKTRCAFEALRRLRGYHVLNLRPEKQNLAEIKIPRTYLIFKPQVLLFMDDLNEYVERISCNDIFITLGKQCKSLQVLATCSVGEELTQVTTSSLNCLMLHQVEIDELPITEAKDLARRLGVEWNEVTYNGTPGSITLPLNRMAHRLDQSTDEALTFMRALYLMHEAGLHSYRRELAEKVATKVYELNVNRRERDAGWLWLETNGYVSSERAHVVPNQSIYVEKNFCPAYNIGEARDVEILCQLISEDKQASEVFDISLNWAKQGNFTRAAESFRSFVTLVPDDPAGHYNLGMALRNLGDDETAKQEFREAIRYDKNYADAHYSLAATLDSDFKFSEKSMFADEWVLWAGGEETRAEIQSEYREAIRCNPNHAEAHYRLGVWLREVLNAEEEQEESFRQAVRSNPDHANAHCALALMLHNKELVVEAEREYREAIRLDPHLAHAHYNLGLILEYRTSPKAEAEKEYRDAIRFDPFYVTAHNSLGWLLHERGDLEGAEKEFREAIRCEASSSIGHNGLGWILYNQGLLQEASIEYGEALRFNAANTYAHNNLGILLERQGQFTSAENEYREAIKCTPYYAAAHYNLAGLQCQQERFEEAESEYRETLRFNPNHSGAHERYAWLLDKRGLTEEAEKEYREAIQCDPKNSWALINLGLLLYTKHFLQEAEKKYRQALVHAPHDADAHYNLGLALFDQGRLEDAIAEYRLAIRFNPDFSMAHNNLGWALSKQGSTRQAEEEYTRAIRCDPKNATAHGNLGYALDQRGLLSQAEKHYVEAIRLDPDDSLNHNNLGWLWERRGRLSDAHSEFNEALRREPKHQYANENLRQLMGRISRLKKAEFDFTDQIHQHPDNPQALYGLAVALCYREAYGEAEEKIREAIRLVPDDPNYHYLLGWALGKIDRTQEAKTEFHTTERLELSAAGQNQL